VVFFTRIELISKLNRLKKGLPTDLIYLNREINNTNVQVPNDYDISTIDEFLEKDIQSVLSLQTSIIRPILGMFGSGKSTILNRIETLVPKVLSPEKCIILKINLENVPILKREEFVKGLMKQILPVIEKENFRNIFEKYDQEKLVNAFQGVKILKNINNLYSKNERDRIEAKSFFLDEVGEELIFQLIEGIVKLSIMDEKIVIILVDELESLIDKDKERVITEIIVSRFFRGLIDRYDNSVYIAITCYKESYDLLKDNFYKFYRIVEGHEIKLGDLSDKEKLELIQRVLDVTMEYTFGKLNAHKILIELKGTLEYYMDKSIKLIVREIF